MAEALYRESGVQRLVSEPVGVDAVVFVKIIVGREQPEPGVTVNASAEFVVRQVRRFLAVCVCAGSQRADGPWRSRQNVLQQLLRDWIEAGRRQLRGRENTGGCARTPGRVVRLAGNNTLPKLRTQLRRPCRAIHSRGVTFVVNELRR